MAAPQSGLTSASQSLTDKKLKSLNYEKAESVCSTDTAAMSTMATIGTAETTESWEKDLEAELDEFEIETSNMGIDIDKDLENFDIDNVDLAKLDIDKVLGK